MIGRLRAEHDATAPAMVRAVLLHELGVLEEAQGDEAAAARDQLSAVNTEPDFREPLERLIAIIERRQSYKNLGRLLERLVRVGETPLERGRALLERGLFQAIHENDLAGARESLEQAAAEQSDDPAIWLALELVAARLDDGPLRARALAARAELSEHAEWRSLLFTDLASLLSEEGDLDAALQALEHPISERTPTTFAALRVLEDVGRSHGRADVLARALSAQATLLEECHDDPDVGDLLGIPSAQRTMVHAADTWLRAAYALRRQGDVQGAIELLDQARERLPDNIALLHARAAAADAMGDTATAARIALRELNAGLTGPSAAARHLRIAEQASAEGDRAAAEEAVRNALAADPGSIPARVLELDLLSVTDPQSLAGAWEALAGQFESDDAKSRALFLAADVWARSCRDVQGAKAALSQAGMYLDRPGVVARVGRMLASLINDDAWYDESTRRLLTAGAADTEQPSLWLELVRARLRRRDLVGMVQALSSLAAAPGGQWLGHALRAFALPLVTTETDPDAPPAVLALATAETDPDVARAWYVLGARRALADGRVADAEHVLRELLDSNPSDLTIAMQLATVLRLDGRLQEAADVLTASAGTISDAPFAAALQIEAGILRWQGGDRGGAVNTLSEAAHLATEAVDCLLGWALRAVAPDDIESRRRALEVGDAEVEPGLNELERFALEAAQGGDPDEARAALQSIPDTADDDLLAAAVLARSLWIRDPGDYGTAKEALEALAQYSPAAAALANGTRVQLELEDGDAADLEPLAATWAATDASPAAALEWLAAATGRGDSEQEAAAQQELARRLGGPEGLALDAGARLIRFLGGDESQPLLPATAPSARIMNLELAPPACDPRRRASAFGDLGDALGDESAAMSMVIAGYNRLASGDPQGATGAFRAAIEALPGDIIGWEGLRVSAETIGDDATIAEACMALGGITTSDTTGAELWERAGLILLERLGDPERAELAFSQAVERDISRSVAFDKLFRMVRQRRDGPRLLDLISARLEVAEDPEEIGKLFWERARVLRKANRIDEALTALENVTMLEPDHVGALALAGEIYLRHGKFPEAAKNLARLAQLDEAPQQQRLMSGVAAVDIFENKLGQLEPALGVLLTLYRSGLSTLPVRERLARTAAKVGAWQAATDVLQELMNERESSEGRVEAARLALAIHRDRLGSPAMARQATARLLGELPGDGEALDMVLAEPFEPSTTEALLVAGLEAVVEQLIEDPLQPEVIDRLARIAARLEDAPRRQASLGALVAVGEGTPEIDAELQVLDERVARLPQIAIDEGALPELCDPDDSGPIGDLFHLAAPMLADALGPNLAAFGVSRRDRVDPRAGLPLRNEIAAWAGALGVDFDLYVGGSDPEGVFAVATERPALVVGQAVTAPLRPNHRQLVARELFALRRGTVILRHRDPTDVAAITVALCQLGGHSLPAPHYAMFDEFFRLISRAMGRKIKRSLPSLAAAVVEVQGDPVRWAAGATASLDRLAAIAAGDVSHVLSTGGRRGQIGASIEAQERASRLLSFVLSPTYLELREQLGMGVR